MFINLTFLHNKSTQFETTNDNFSNSNYRRIEWHGEALAYLFAREQQTLVLVARRKDKLDGLAKALNSQYGVKVHVIALDLQQIGAAAQLMNEVSNLKLSLIPWSITLVLV